MNDKTDMNDTTDKPAVFTDTHTHLADPLLAERAAEVIRQADGAGVRRFIVPSANRGDWKAVSDLAADNIIPAFGIHPWWAGGTSERQDLDKPCRLPCRTSASMGGRNRIGLSAGFR